MSVVYSCVFFFKQKTAYEMRISDWSSDVCSSDLENHRQRGGFERYPGSGEHVGQGAQGRAPLEAVVKHESGSPCGRWVAATPAAGRGSRRCRRSEERRVGQECGRTCRSRW